MPVSLGSLMDLFCVSECCPVGCGMPVVLLASRTANRLFCYCDGCGCVWQTPADAKFEVGMNDVVDVSEFAPDGVEPPSRQSIIDAGLAGAVIADIEEDDWVTSIGELNRSIIERRRVGPV
jgi:hypothetical protein